MSSSRRPPTPLPIRFVTTIVAALVALVALAGPRSPARADEPAPTSSKVLGLHVEGARLTAKDRQDLFQVLQSKLRLYPGVELKNPPENELTDEMIDLECIDLDASCLAALGKKYGADRVVYVEAEPGVGAEHTLKTRFVDVATGKLERDNTLKVPAAAALAPALEAEVEAVFGKPPTVVSGGAMAMITIETDQPGALVYLGSEVVGVGRVTFERPAGDYTIRIAATGYEEQILKITVTEGQAILKTVAMVKLEAPKPKKPDDDDGPSWVLWAVIGAVVVGGAITAIALSSGSEDSTVRGPAVLSIDGAAAWRDPATFGGRP
ncbi:MAG: PEGA domain-containing protein [Deltaproteobacteria bacterium]|nr:PEGA domain-containing protein [Deltaproteobacteria bacterium]